MAAGAGRLPYKVPCSARPLGHRVLGSQRPTGARAEGAGLGARAGGGLGAAAAARGDAAAPLQVRTRRSGARRGRAWSRAAAQPLAPPRTPVTPGAPPSRTLAAHVARDAGGPGRRIPPALRRRGLSCAWAAVWAIVAVAVAGGCAQGSQVHLGRLVPRVARVCGLRAMSGRSRPGGSGRGRLWAL